MVEKTFGVIGDPVAHSLSPVMHNAAFAKLKLDAKYERFPVAADALGAFFERLRGGEIAGVNVTVPHKQAVMPFLDVLSPEVQAIGAVNVIVNDGGKLVGHNTDGSAYLKSLFTEFTLNMAETYVVLIGAGGAALAVAYALAGTGVASLEIVNRDKSRAENLAARLQLEYPGAHFPTAAFADLTGICADADLVVNTTCLGMAGKAWPDLSFVDALPDHAIVSDIVYVPKETELLKKASERGLKIHYGSGMLLYQAARAFELFTGNTAPVETMRDALEKAFA